MWNCANLSIPYFTISFKCLSYVEMSIISFESVEQYKQMPIVEQRWCCTRYARSLGISLLCSNGPSPCSFPLRTLYCKDNSRSLGLHYVALCSYPHYLVCLHLLYDFPWASSFSLCLSLATQSCLHIWPELIFLWIKRAYKIVGGRVRLMRV